MIDVALDLTDGAAKPLQGMVSLSCDESDCDAVLFIGLVPKREGVEDAVDLAATESGWRVVNGGDCYCPVARRVEDHPVSAETESEWVQTDSKILRAIQRWFDRHPKALARMDRWLTEHERCEWRTAGGAQCVNRKGHRGVCCTEYNYGPPKFWYGINYPDRKAL